MIDQHVFRAFAVITRITKPTAPKNWDEYVSYRDFFFALAQAAGIIHERPQGYEDNPSEITGELKKVDDALFAFGQFLNRYNPSSSKADNASSLATN